MPKPKRYRNWPIAEVKGDVALDCLSKVALSLMTLPVDAAISEVMVHLGQKLHADRCWMFEYDDDLVRFRNTHEWCTKGLIAHVEDLQDTPVSTIAWLHRGLLAGKAVMIDEVAALPPSAQALRREMLRQGDKSVLSVPVFHEGKLRACIGFDTVHKARAWTDAEAALLAACGRLIARARYAVSDSSRSISKKERNAPLIYLSNGGRVRGVTFDQIVGIRSRRNETLVWLDDGSLETDRRSISAWRTLLPPARFPSLHRTAIVNLIHIAALDKHGGAGFHWQLRIRGVDEPWPVSRQYRTELVQRLGW